MNLPAVELETRRHLIAERSREIDKQPLFSPITTA